MGLVLTFMRFTQGLGAVTNLDSYTPWGFWIGFDLLAGVALAAGGYTTSAGVYLFRHEKIPRRRPACDPDRLLGLLPGSRGFALRLWRRPLRLPYPFLVQQGTTSVMFEVAACVALYLTVLFLEFSSAPLEWLGIKKVARIISKLTILLTIFGVVLSTLHQSSLGAMYLMAPSKLHPLWYSSFMPVFFFVSSIAAGISMVLFEASISHKFFHHKMDKHYEEASAQLVFGFGKAGAVVLAAYFAIKVIGVSLDHNWKYLATGYGAWFLVEILGFVLLPCFLYALGVRDKNKKLIQYTAGWTVLGIIVNRLNVSLVAFNYHLAQRPAVCPALDGNRHFRFPHNGSRACFPIYCDAHADFFRTPGFSTG